MSGKAKPCGVGAWDLSGDGDGFLVTSPLTLLEILADLGSLTHTIDLRCPGPPSLDGRCGAVGVFETEEKTLKTPHYVCALHEPEWRREGAVLFDVIARLRPIRKETP